jgi:hypothetical protein
MHRSHSVHICRSLYSISAIYNHPENRPVTCRARKCEYSNILAFLAILLYFQHESHAQQATRSEGSLRGSRSSFLEMWGR